MKGPLPCHGPAGMAGPIHISSAVDGSVDPFTTPISIIIIRGKDLVCFRAKLQLFGLITEIANKNFLSLFVSLFVCGFI